MAQFGNVNRTDETDQMPAQAIKKRRLMWSTYLDKYLVLNSIDRDSGTNPEDYTRQLHDPIAGSYKVYSVSLPKFYNVRADNNQIYFFDNNTNRTGTIQPGRYTMTQLTERIGQAMTTGSGFQAYSVTFDADTGKLTILAGNNFKFRFSATLTNSAHKILGFNLTETALATSHTAPNAADLNSPMQVWIDFSNEALAITDGKNQVGSFPIDLAFDVKQMDGSMQVYLPPRDDQIPLVFRQPTHHLRVRLFHAETGQLLSTNGLDWCITLVQHSHDLS